MKTSDLITALANDKIVAPKITPALLAALGVGIVVSASFFFATLGPRPDIAAAAETMRFLFKFVVTILLAATASWAVLRLSRPGARTSVALGALIALPILLALAIGLELMAVPSSLWMTRLIGQNSRVCMEAIPTMALPLLIAAFVALRFGAPTRPALTGAMAGLLAGGVAATLYAAHCPDDSPLFVAVWYSLAVGSVAAVGALIGARILRW
jgi:hypothetical protein